MSDINEIPESFNKTLLEKALLEYTQDASLELIDYIILDNSAEVSHHFSSILFKLELNYKRTSDDSEIYKICAIVKTLPDAPDQSHNVHLEFVKETTQFDTELKVYDKILPKMDLMLYAAGLQILAPRQIYQISSPVPILIMENMIAKGYTTINDRSQITFDSAKILIGKLAQFHATSFVLDKQMDKTVAQLNMVYFDFHMDKSYCEDMDRCIVAMKKLNGFESIVEKLEGKSEDLFDKVRDVYYSPNDASLKVLCHGDMKFENTLVKTNDENDVENGIFVDFAYANYHTPAIDLFEFLYKVPALDIIVNKELRGELINFYLDTFKTTLTTLTVESVDETIDGIKSEINRCDVLQLWYVMFLVVYTLETFNEEIEAEPETINYEEQWLKTVLDGLLNLNA